MSVNATSNVKVTTTSVQTLVIPASHYKGLGYTPVAVGDTTFVLAHALRAAGVPSGSEPIRVAAPGGPASYVVGVPGTPNGTAVQDAITKGALIFANSTDATTAST